MSNNDCIIYISIFYCRILIFLYIICLNQIFLSEKRGKLHQVTLPAVQTTVNLQGLHPGTSYSVQVFAQNDVGQGDPSQPITFRTVEEGMTYCFTQIFKNNMNSALKYFYFSHILFQYIISNPYCLGTRGSSDFTFPS